MDKNIKIVDISTEFVHHILHVQLAMSLCQVDVADEKRERERIYNDNLKIFNINSTNLLSWFFLLIILLNPTPFLLVSVILLKSCIFVSITSYLVLAHVFLTIQFPCSPFLH